MKVSSKPISSPCRGEKYPPQLMRFLRSNVGSRSRGRSRSSPMFVRRKHTPIETQEPSSPKVTCMGQVRVRRSKQTAPPGAPICRSSRCKWITNALFCHNFPGKVKAKPFVKPSWEKWGTFFLMGSCRKPQTREDSSKYGNKMEGSEEEEEAKIFASSSCSSPPKNALILTRCRSAPYRSSSLAFRFWGSPLANHETNEEAEVAKRGFEDEEEKESICRNSETEEKPGLCSKIEEKEIEETERSQEPKTEQQGNVGPVVLTRCKSEPARNVARLDPEMRLWKKRTLGFT
ncbi:hypothetical protein ERO13_D09G147000v2 [Gossypium hirsutum]|uniref:Protamine P1 family protein n=1 Tax=Gossypium hirsutum TaxID=3635 RepID=A0A1U8HZ20_GOSHI|nr:uncharacterized protein LOC107891114 [Gossypium hirsutum]KAG4130486.1 hypothetical protein ERO13_D09G147000v2 [Gossypium hirsutum]